MKTPGLLRNLSLGVLLLTFATAAQSQFVINSFQSGGRLSATGVLPGEVISVQWADSIDGPWTSSLDDLSSILVTSQLSRITLPIPPSDNFGFFRLRRNVTKPIATYIGDRAITNVAAGAHTFVPPAGDGRGRRNGLWMVSDSSWQDWGTLWDFDYQFSDKGLQVIHPFQDGQVILHIERNYLGVSTPTRWVNVGYGSGDTNLLSRTPSFATVFPLETGTNYEVKTSVSVSGLISVWFDTSLVATGRVATAHPIDFEVRTNETFAGASSWNTRQFTGTNFPLVWQRGYSGLIVKPVDTGYNRVSNLRHAPGM